jgi:plastocyanin
MKTGIAAGIACCALVLTAGCGSSSTSATTAATTRAPTTTSSSAVGLKGDTASKFAAPSPSAPVQSGLVQIAYRNIAIDPDTARVKLGSTIKWTNYDSAEHNVTSEGGPQKFASKDFGEGGTFEVTASRPGVIHYENTLEPATMNGTIEVVK